MTQYRDLFSIYGRSNEAVSEPDSLAGVVPARPATKKFDFVNPTPTDLEDFVFDLLRTIGFVNVVWRKGRHGRV